jgi:hypothetical protein
MSDVVRIAWGIAVIIGRRPLRSMRRASGAFGATLLVGSAAVDQDHLICGCLNNNRVALSDIKYGYAQFVAVRIGAAGGD